MKIITENNNIDWKEAFFILAVLVVGGRIDDARKYVYSVIGRPSLIVIE